jgi:tryptophanyl-tRNA synthetase
MRILSGIQPTGRPHIGNYFGMMEPAIRLQDEGEAFYFIADYHSLTSINNAAMLREHVLDLAIDFLACGLDPAKATFFRQSDVPEVTELTWILGTLTPIPMLENCHSYKDKTARGMTPNAGLFTYPVLMAADILIYDSDIVPVGRDQKQHIEVTRDVAAKLNNTYGEVLKIPKAWIKESTAVVPGIDDEKKKMSKSYNNYIGVFEEEKALRKKIMGIKTDSTPVEEPKNPDGNLIVTIYKLMAGEEQVATLEADFRRGGTGYGDFKKRLFETMWDYFAPMRAKRAELEASPDYVHDVLRRGAEKARGIAQQTMDRVRKATGLR